MDIAGPDILRLYVSPAGFRVEETFLALLLGPNPRDSRFLCRHATLDPLVRRSAA